MNKRRDVDLAPPVQQNRAVAETLIKLIIFN